MNRKYYEFRCFLKGHLSEVRCIAASSDGINIASASRDGKCKLWKLEDDRFISYHTFETESGYANCIKFVQFKESTVILIGGHNRNLQMRSIIDGAILETFFGHSDAINCVECTSSTVLTGSSDHTIKLWDYSGRLQHTFVYHTLPVWCLSVFDDGFFSGAADSSIVYWKDQYPSKTYIGHDGPVRSLIVITHARELISASNDTSIKVWNIDTRCCRHTLMNHKHFLYSLCYLQNSNLLVSCGEEKCIKIWKNYQLYEEIIVPGLSNWNVIALKNDDLVIASSYPDVLIFTTAHLPKDCKQQQEEYNEAIKASINSTNSLKDINLDEIPDVHEIESVKGSFDGEVKMFRQNKKVLVYEWSIQEECWKLLGNVASQIEPEIPKTLFNGKEYDHVIDVSMDDGRTLKLPYNDGQDPIVATERFLINNNLNSFYHQQVLDFLIANIPSARNYNPKNKLKVLSPFSYPIKKRIVFNSTNLNGLFARIHQVYPHELGNDFDQLKTLLKTTLNITSLDHPSCDVPLSFINNLLGLGGTLLLPTLDTIKQLVLIKEFFQIFFINHQNIFQQNLITFSLRFLGEDEDVKFKNLVLRIYCNCMIHFEHDLMFMQYLNQLNHIFIDALIWIDCNLSLSLSSILFNYSIIFVNNLSEYRNLYVKFLSTVTWIIDAFFDTSDQESIYRLLCSVANLVSVCSVESDLRESSNNLTNLFKKDYSSVNKYQEPMKFIIKSLERLNFSFN